MNPRRKGYRLENEAVRAARAKGLNAQRVPMSGHLGRRGGTTGDVIIKEWRFECKNWARGVSSAVVETAMERDGVHGVIHKRPRGILLVTLSYEDFLDLLAAAKSCE